MEDKHQERRISDATALPDDKHLIYDDPPASASLKSQLATWHANRGDRSFWSMVIPRWRVADTENSGETKNPIKLFRMVDGRSWLLFISAWWAWTVDGYDFFAVSLTAGRLSEQFGRDTKVSLPETYLQGSKTDNLGNHNGYHSHVALSLPW